MNGITVVLADDTPDIRELVRVTLEFDGRFSVVGEAEDGEQAVKLVGEHAPHIALLDLAMPVMDGLEAIPLIRSLSPKTKIAILSGFSASRVAATAQEAGADIYIEKGINIRQLPETLASLVREIFPDGSVEHEIRSDAPEEREPVERPDELELLSMVTHEMRTPLTIMKGFAATLVHSVEKMDQSTIKESASAIERHADNLDDLVKSFEAADQLERGKLKLEISQIQLADLLRETIHDLEEVVEPHPIVLLCPETLEATVDPTRFRQVITNLITNASKFSPPKCPIEITVEVTDERVQIGVRDHGPGIPPSREDELFKRFSRLDAKTKGTGIGLFITRGIARAHGGEVTFIRPKGQGSIFLFELPLQSAAWNPNRSLSSDNAL